MHNLGYGKEKQSVGRGLAPAAMQNAESTPPSRLCRATSPYTVEARSAMLADLIALADHACDEDGHIVGTRHVLKGGGKNCVRVLLQIAFGWF